MECKLGDWHVSDTPQIYKQSRIIHFFLLKNKTNTSWAITPHAINTPNIKAAVFIMVGAGGV